MKAEQMSVTSHAAPEEPCRRCGTEDQWGKNPDWSCFYDCLACGETQIGELTWSDPVEIEVEMRVEMNPDGGATIHMDNLT